MWGRYGWTPCVVMRAVRSYRRSYCGRTVASVVRAVPSIVARTMVPAGVCSVVASVARTMVVAPRSVVVITPRASSLVVAAVVCGSPRPVVVIVAVSTGTCSLVVATVVCGSSRPVVAYASVVIVWTCGLAVVFIAIIFVPFRTVISVIGCT